MTCFCLLSCLSPVSPEIIQAPQSLTVNVTDTAQFNCTVLSYPALNYLQWYFLDTNRLLNSDRLIVIMHSSEINATDGTVILSSVLKIVRITLFDAGKYQCRAGVPNFPPVNVTATLTVQCEFLILIFLLLLILLQLLQLFKPQPIMLLVSLPDKLPLSLTSLGIPLSLHLATFIGNLMGQI